MLETKKVSSKEVGNGRTNIATSAKIPIGRIALPTKSRMRATLKLPIVKSMIASYCQKLDEFFQNQHNFQLSGTNYDYSRFSFLLKTNKYLIRRHRSKEYAN